jgi:hypothetical protein
MGTEKSLGLPDRFEPPHSSLPDPGTLMRLLRPIIRIPGGIMNRFRNQLPVSNSIASQLIRHDFPGFATMAPQQASEEPVPSEN